jgi:hypothetical protein
VESREKCVPRFAAIDGYGDKVDVLINPPAQNPHVVTSAFTAAPKVFLSTPSTQQHSSRTARVITYSTKIAGLLIRVKFF